MSRSWFLSPSPGDSTTPTTKNHRQPSFFQFVGRANALLSLSPRQVRTLARTDEARGLLWLMEEEAVQPGGSEETMLDRLFSYYGSVQGEGKGERWSRRSRPPPPRNLTCVSARFQEASCCCEGRSPTSSCWATATGQTGSSTTLKAGWATPATTPQPRTPPRCCRTPKSRNRAERRSGEPHRGVLE